MKKIILKLSKNILIFLLGIIISTIIATKAATTIASENVTYENNGQETVEGALNDLIAVADDYTLNKMYPIGSIYISINNTSPATLFGGTWKAINKDLYFRTISSGTGGTTGGSFTSGSTTLTVDQIPSHEHKIRIVKYGTDTGKYPSTFQQITNTNIPSGYSQYNNGEADSSIAIKSTGGGQGHTHTIDPPYYTVYAWVRTK